MSFMLSNTVAVRLRDLARLAPFEIGEIRRIKGMGAMYFALTVTQADPKLYTKFFCLSIDGVSYTCYFKAAL